MDATVLDTQVIRPQLSVGDAKSVEPVGVRSRRYSGHAVPNSELNWGLNVGEPNSAIARGTGTQSRR
ncbi:MAG: hypothetical protein ACJAZO_004797 [Myxococcota bacterium]|jgi:hypothetical protein